MKHIIKRSVMYLSKLKYRKKLGNFNVSGNKNKMFNYSNIK